MSGRRRSLLAWNKPGLIFFDGNSLTFGSNSTGGQTYPQQVVDGLPSGLWEGRNLGVGALTTNGMIANAPFRIDGQINQRRSRHIVIGWEGTNDLFFGATPAQSYSRLKTYYMGRRTWDTKIIAASLLPRGVDPQFEMDRLTLSSLLRGGWPDFADAFIDVALDPTIGAPGANMNSLHYGDLTHLNNMGYGIMAGLAIQAIQSLAW